MNLPFADQAIVEERKLTEYLLNPDHPIGRSKADFFIRLRFKIERPELLSETLHELACTTDMREAVSPYGRKFSGTGICLTPSGRETRITTLWMLRNSMPPPILITAYPS